MWFDFTTRLYKISFLNCKSDDQTEWLNWRTRAIKTKTWHHHHHHSAYAWKWTCGVTGCFVWVTHTRPASTVLPKNRVVKTRYILFYNKSNKKYSNQLLIKTFMWIESSVLQRSNSKWISPGYLLGTGARLYSANLVPEKKSLSFYRWWHLVTVSKLISLFSQFPMPFICLVSASYNLN